MMIDQILARIPEAYGRWIQVGPGWHDIIIRLDSALADIDPDYTVVQVKEKFGGLRYYIQLSEDIHQVEQLRKAAYQLVRDAEAESLKTCERCGAQGDTVTREPLGGGYWTVTWCEKCRGESNLTG